MAKARKAPQLPSNVVSISLDTEIPPMPAPPVVPARAEPITVPAAEEPARPIRYPRARNRVGLVTIQGFFDKSVQDQLRGLAGFQGSTVQGMLEEALNDLFKKYKERHNTHAIAETGREDGRAQKMRKRYRSV